MKRFLLAFLVLAACATAPDVTNPPTSAELVQAQVLAQCDFWAPSLPALAELISTFVPSATTETTAAAMAVQAICQSLPRQVAKATPFGASAWRAQRLVIRGVTVDGFLPSG